MEKEVIIRLNHKPEELVSFCESMLEVARQNEDTISFSYAEDLCTATKILAAAIMQKREEMEACNKPPTDRRLK